MFEKAIPLPFKQNASTVRKFTFLFWTFYFNRARPCTERHSGLLHDKYSESFWRILNFCYGISSEGRVWISHETRPSGSYVAIKNSTGRTSFIHRITARIRESYGTRYLQLIFFSWWVGVVRKDDAQFIT